MLVTTGQDGLEQMMARLNAVDFKSLNQAIRNLADVVEPLAKFFNVLDSYSYEVLAVKRLATLQAFLRSKREISVETTIFVRWSGFLESPVLCCSLN